MTDAIPLTRVLLVSSLLMLFLYPTASLIGNEPTSQTMLANQEPLSIILMIGDGMGFEHIRLAQLVEVGENGSLAMQRLIWNASVTTHSANAAITDSAAGGTAIATGHKTNNYMVGVLPNGTPVESILEYAQSLNKSSGVISTCRIVDATPATFMTHVDDRYSMTEIARQLVEEASVDVLLGGGTSYFSSDQIDAMISNGYSVVYDRSSMMAVTTGRILGLFGAIHMDYEIDRNYVTTPSIAEMTNKSIELLSQDPDGFFLMVEGGQIDLAAHDESKVNNALETIEFDRAVKVALDYVKVHSNTILIVTADHETMGLVVLSHDLDTELPSSLLTQNENETLRIARANNVTVDWTATYHTAWQVPLFCYGSAFSGLPLNVTIDNTNTFALMKDYFLGNPLNVPPVEIPTTTTTTTTDSTTTATTSQSPTTTGAPFDTSMLAIAAIGAAVVVVVVLISLRRK
jgi:alkaline phosphatase